MPPGQIPAQASQKQANQNQHQNVEQFVCIWHLPGHLRKRREERHEEKKLRLRNRNGMCRPLIQ